MSHLRSSRTPSQKLQAASKHARMLVAVFPKLTARAALEGPRSSTQHLQQELIRDQSTLFPSVGKGGESIIRPSPETLPGVLSRDGEEEEKLRLVPEKFHPGRASEERRSSRMTFPFTVLLRHASSAKGYCNIYTVSVAPP